MLPLIVEMRQQALETLVRDDWCVELAVRGMNGLVFRASHADGRDYAVKVTRRDHRHRAQREFTALTLLQESGITARPIAVHPDVPDLPDSSVIVTEWIDANPYESPDSLTGHVRIQQIRDENLAALCNQGGATRRLRWRTWRPSPVLAAIWARMIFGRRRANMANDCTTPPCPNVRGSIGS